MGLMSPSIGRLPQRRPGGAFEPCQHWLSPGHALSFASPAGVSGNVLSAFYSCLPMQFRLPWILSRKRLITSVLLDGGLFVTLYCLLYQWRFDVWPALSLRLGLLLTIWLLVSYVIGRYPSGNTSDRLNFGWSFIAKQIVETGFVLALTLGITLLHIWLFGRNPVQATFRSFLIPFLASLGFLSLMVQFSLRYLILTQQQRHGLLWSYVGSSEGYQRLQQMLRWSRLPVQLQHVLPEQVPIASTGQFVIDRFYDQPQALLEALVLQQQQGSVVLNRLDWCEIILQRFPAELLQKSDVLDGEFLVPSGTLQSRLKRAGDVSFSAFLLLLTSPLLLISALLIKLDDGGPVFYSQIRTGLEAKPYKIWKLRSMRTNAEQMGAQWSSRADSRVTRIGAFLRRTRLDELPQLWCVLTGSMSLIGPRPERPEFDLQLVQQIPHYALRHLIRPGLSGWAQVNYPYGASVEDSSNKLSYDLYYLKNFSFLLDLLIMFKTIRLVFNAQGSLPENSKVHTTYS